MKRLFRHLFTVCSVGLVAGCHGSLPPEGREAGSCPPANTNPGEAPPIGESLSHSVGEALGRTTGKVFELAKQCAEFAVNHHRWPESIDELRESLDADRSNVLDSFERLDLRPKSDGGIVVEYVLREDEGVKANGQLTLPAWPAP